MSRLKPKPIQPRHRARSPVARSGLSCLQGCFHQVPLLQYQYILFDRKLSIDRMRFQLSFDGIRDRVVPWLLCEEYKTD